MGLVGASVVKCSMKTGASTSAGDLNLSAVNPNLSRVLSAKVSASHHAAAVETMDLVRAVPISAGRATEGLSVCASNVCAAQVSSQTQSRGQNN